MGRFSCLVLLRAATSDPPPEGCCCSPPQNAEDPAKKGICSNYLCDAKPGDEVTMTGEQLQI